MGFIGGEKVGLWARGVSEEYPVDEEFNDGEEVGSRGFRAS